MTYLKTNTNLASASPLEFIWDEDMAIVNPDIKYTVNHILYHGKYLSASQAIPTNVYNQTAYTLVTETSCLNEYIFCTEKIVKPILAERLFLVIAGAGYLKNLRRLGFKTFDGIIDEGYDNVDDLNLRILMVLRQLATLNSLPQSQVLEQVSEITKHNKKVMMETDWLGITHQTIKNVILGYSLD
jgi:hypothetical protein